jgi:hypothetical protein
VRLGEGPQLDLVLHRTDATSDRVEDLAELRADPAVITA